MPLNEAKIPLKLGGLDSKTDSRWVLPGDLVTAENVIYDHWPKISKRNGYGSISSAASSGALLSSFKSQLLLGTGIEGYAYSATGGLTDVGVLESAGVSTFAVRRDVYTLTQPDIAVHPTGITVSAWSTSAGGSQYAVFDTATKQVIVPATTLSSSICPPKVLSLGSYVVVLYQGASPATTLLCLPIPAATPTTPNSVVTLATNFGPANFAIPWDATVINGTLYFVTGPQIGQMSSALTVGTALTIPDSYTQCVSVFGDASNNVWLTYYDGTHIRAFAYNAALTVQQLAPTTVDAFPGNIYNIAGVCVSGTTATILYEFAASPTTALYNNRTQTATITLAGAISNVNTLVRSIGLWSKPVVYQGRIHFVGTYNSGTPNLQSTFFLFSCNGGSAPKVATVVAKLAPSVAGSKRSAAPLTEMPSVTAGVYTTAYTVEDQINNAVNPSGSHSVQAGIQAATFDFTQAQSASELSDNLHISGGIVSMFDGTQVCEHGFHLYPENLSFTATGGPTGGVFNGDYQLIAVYEWMDAQGLIHQSSPSPAVKVTATNNTQFNYSCSTLRITSKKTPVTVVFYRTGGTLNTVGTPSTVFYRVTPTASPIINTTTTDTVSGSDFIPDVTLTDNAQSYNNPDNTASEVPNIPASAALHVWRYRNRVAFIPSENPFEWSWSKAYVPGLPIEFNNQQFYQAVAQDGGPLTCGIEMDDKNILFTGSKIYFLQGDGPSANGSSSDYGLSPQAIPTDVGCTNKRSLVLTPQGVMFQSAKGIYLLGRDLQVRYIGAPVEAYNSLTITAARLVPNSRRVIFFTNTAQALVYDYSVEKWAIHTNMNAVDATSFGGLTTYVNAAGAIYQETPGVFNEASPILIKLVTSWLSFAGINGFQRVWRFIIRGDYKSAHTLTVSVAYDDAASPLQSTDVVAATTLSPIYELLVHCKKQKCSNMQITLAETQPGGAPYGEGFSLSGITFLTGVTGRGMHPVPSGRGI